MEYDGREELLIAHLAKMLATKQDDSADRRSTATFDDVYDSSYRRSTATFDYDYSSSSAPSNNLNSSLTGQVLPDTGSGTDVVMSPAILEDGDDAENESSSSSVGSSDWSSDDGFSSIDAASLSASETDGRPISPDTTATIAAISEASALNSQVTSLHHVSNPMYSNIKSNPDSPNDTDQANDREMTEGATQNDLDKAIEAGDWRAVSATAALIANSFPPEDISSEYDDSPMTESTKIQVKEFDQLVEDGNWEAVIAAATRFESSSDVEGFNEPMDTLDESSTEFEEHQQDPEPYTGQANTHQEELIAEIKELVAEVVPDEMGK